MFPLSQLNGPSTESIQGTKSINGSGYTLDFESCVTDDPAQVFLYISCVASVDNNKNKGTGYYLIFV